MAVHRTLYDPYVPAFSYDALEMTSANDLEGELGRADCVVIATNPSGFDWERVANFGRCVVDTRHVM